VPVAQQQATPGQLNRPFGHRETVPGHEVNWLSSLEATSVTSLAEIGVEDTTARRRGSSGQDCVYLGERTRSLVGTTDPRHSRASPRQWHEQAVVRPRSWIRR